jgi:hypothetical protein
MDIKSVVLGHVEQIYLAEADSRLPHAFSCYTKYRKINHWQANYWLLKTDAAARVR